MSMNGFPPLTSLQAAQKTSSAAGAKDARTSSATAPELSARGRSTCAAGSAVTWARSSGSAPGSAGRAAITSSTGSSSRRGRRNFT